MKTLISPSPAFFFALIAFFALVMGTPPASAAPGDLDSLDVNLTGGGIEVLATAVQPDGKTIIAGFFTQVLGVPRNNIARLNADGTLDMGFDPNVNSYVYSVAVQADGKVLLGGEFTGLQPNGAASATTRNFIARVNADGTLDTGFDPNAENLVYCMTVQADGKVLLGGDFNSLQPNGAATATARNKIARVNADGTLDTGFDPNPNGVVNSVAVQADGKVLLGGEFTGLQPNGAASATARNKIARVNADGTLDTGFDPNLSNGGVLCVTVQADGKVLLGGQFTRLQPNGAAAFTTRQNIARVNADGTVDMGFDPNVNSTVNSVAVQADGKVLLGGFFTSLQPNGAASATTRNRIARVNADGTLDTGFDPNVGGGLVYSVAVQTDGKVLLGGLFSSLQPNGAASATTRNSFARLTNDPATQVLTADVRRVLWSRSGSGPELSATTFEQSTDGGTTWTPLGSGTRVGSTANWQFTGLTLPSNVSIRARGRTAGGYLGGTSGLIEQVENFTGLIIPAPTVASIVPNTGSTAGGTSVTITGTHFTGAMVVTVGGVALDSPVIGFNTITGTTGSNAAGVVDVVITTPDGTGTSTGAFTYVREQAGNLELDLPDLNISGSQVRATAVQPDGKIIIAGRFDQVLGVTRNNIARLNADGTLDTGFDPNVSGGSIGIVYSVAVQADGKVLLGGEFTSVQPNGAATATTRNRIARVNADGTLDTGFDPNANDRVYSVAVQTDGKVLLGGEFTSLQPNGAASATTLNRIARVNADGTLDTGFDPNVSGGLVRSVAVQADGKILLGGAFDSLQPNGAATATTRKFIARVNADGTLDTGFDANLKLNSTVLCVTVQADGKVLIGGQGAFELENVAYYIARLNANGTRDTGFNLDLYGPSASVVYSVALQADGKVLLGGDFTTVLPNDPPFGTTSRKFIARVHADGTLDRGFDPNIGDEGDFLVLSVAVQADGKVLLGGFFDSLQPNGAASATTRNNFARLYNDEAAQVLTAPDATQVLWSRSGAGPELISTTFEQSTDGGTTWTSLGSGTRVGSTANWQLNGLALPGTVSIRARGRTSGGGSGLIEQVADFTGLTFPLEDWRQLYYGPTATNTGIAANAADPYGTGIPNLLVFAFLGPDQDPATAQISDLPQHTTDAVFLTYQFTGPTGVAGILYGAESSATLDNDWLPVTDTGTAPEYIFRIPLGSDRMFLRLNVIP